MADWQLRMSKFDLDVAHLACIKYQAANKPLHFTTTVEEQARIGEDPSPATLELRGSCALHTLLIANIETFSDGENTRAQAQAVGYNDARKERAAPAQQKRLQHHGTDAF